MNKIDTEAGKKGNNKDPASPHRGISKPPRVGVSTH
jgi:hypothetical protein